jgi:hypothetical protein
LKYKICGYFAPGGTFAFIRANEKKSCRSTNNLYCARGTNAITAGFQQIAN